MPTQFIQDESKYSAEEVVRTQQAFIERGLISLADAKKSGEYVSSADVLRKLEERFARALKKAQK